MVRYYLKKGHHPNMQDSLGNTSLHWAILFKDIKCLKLLIDAGPILL